MTVKAFLSCLLLIPIANCIRITKYHVDQRYPFTVYWNVPTEKCQTHGLHFSSILDDFGIIHNEGDRFRGRKITILYDPGNFPVRHTLTNGTVVLQNGGSPVEGNVTKHLDALREYVEKFVVPDFEGLGIIDFEIWRPIFRQNWNAQVYYPQRAVELTMKRNDSKGLDTREIREKAKKEYEEKARDFLEKTLKEVEKLRPDGLWGYYGFPYCYNYRSSEMSPECPKLAVEENDQSLWLYDISTALYPSIYLSIKLNETEHRRFIVGKMNEVSRVVSMTKHHPPVYAYTWFRYLERDEYLTEEDIFSSFRILKTFGLGGAIIWGKYSDVHSKEKCQDLMEYLKHTLGPAVQSTMSEDSTYNNTLLMQDFV